MTPAPVTAPAAREPGFAPEPRRRLRLWILATLVLLVASAALRAIAAANTDVLPIDALLRDARDVYLPWLRGETAVWATLFQAHDAGARLWPIAWVGLNGQADARILALGAICFGLLALTVLFHLLSGRLRPAAFALLAAAALALFISPAFVRLGPATGADATAITVALSLLHLALAGSARAGSTRLVAGFACGLLNVLNASAGIASVLALALWSAIEARRGTKPPPDAPRIFAGHLVLAVFGAVLVALRAGTVGRAPQAGAETASLAWPFFHGGWAVVVWAPAAACVVRWLLRPAATDSHASILPLLALWAGLLFVVSAVTGGAGGPAAFAASLIVNAACLGAAAGGPVGLDARRFAAAALWVILVANALLAPLSHRDRVGQPPAPEPASESAWQLALRRDDTSALTERHGWSPARVDAALGILRDPLVGRILPASIRAPLNIEWESPRAGAAFFPAAALAPPAPNELPVFGPRIADATVAKGDHVSRPLQTTFPILQTHVLGELRPPATSLTLRAQHGGVAKAWTGPFSSPTRWRRIHFDAPPGSFQIVVHDADAAAGFAFTAPVELGRFSWLAGKVPGLWPWFFAGALASAALAARIAWRTRSAGVAVATPPAVRPGRWQLVPWLALAAYGVFWSGHVDTTAGPNDSGGYLNAAKLLAGGTLTAAPHAPLTAVTTAAEVAPYVPGTFRPTADGRMAPNYPLGFPLLVALLAQVLPLDAAVGACLWLHVVAGVVLVLRMARVTGLADGWAWLAAGIVGLSPVYLFHGLQPMSDVPALVWVTAAIYLAWPSALNARRAFLAGVATAVAVLIRPTNLFCALPILIGLAGHWRALAWWIAGGLPLALGLGWINHTLYGGIFANGYGDIRTMLGPEFFGLTVQAYARWLPLLFTPVVCLAPVALFLRGIAGRTRLILLAWAAPFLIFYAFYWCTWDHWAGMRFVLPAAPALIIAGLLALQPLLPRLRVRLLQPGAGLRQFAASAALVAALLGSLLAVGMKENLLFWLHGNREHAVVTQWLRAHAPANAIVLANLAAGSVMYYTDLTCLRVDFAQPAMLPDQQLDRIRRSGRPVYAIIHQVDLPGGAAPPAGAWGTAGEWRKVATPWHDGASVWRWQTADSVSLTAPRIEPRRPNAFSGQSHNR